MNPSMRLERNIRIMVSYQSPRVQPLDETRIDLSYELDEESANQWARESGRSTSPQIYLDDPDFLDPDSDVSDGPAFDVVFDRPASPGSPVELWCLDGDAPRLIGIFRSLDAANDVAFHSHFGSFGIRFR
jgi:hypothetical protein